MRVKVIKPFADKYTNKMHAVGEIIILPDERASIAIERGFAVLADAPEAPKKPARRAKKKED